MARASFPFCFPPPALFCHLDGIFCSRTCWFFFSFHEYVGVKEVESMEGLFDSGKENLYWCTEREWDLVCFPLPQLPSFHYRSPDAIFPLVKSGSRGLSQEKRNERCWFSSTPIPLHPYLCNQTIKKQQRKDKRESMDWFSVALSTPSLLCAVSMWKPREIKKGIYGLSHHVEETNGIAWFNWGCRFVLYTRPHPCLSSMMAVVGCIQRSYPYSQLISEWSEWVSEWMKCVHLMEGFCSAFLHNLRRHLVLA